VLAGGVLSLRLEIRSTRWQPEGPGGIALTVPAFAEEGKAPDVPGPMIRVPAGTRVAVHVSNALSSETVTIHGLHDRPGHADQTIALKPGEGRDVSFAAGPPGTFFYWATTAGAATTEDRIGDGMLTGAIIVDPPGSAAEDDRVFVFGDWNDDDRSSQTPNAFAHTAYVIKGDSAPLAGDARRSVVTHAIGAGRTIAMTWTPGQPGSWLFHCHILFHVDPLLRLTPEPAHDGHDHGEDGERHMAGLVMAINVTPAAGRATAAEPSNPRRLTLEVGQRPGVSFTDPDNPKGTWPGLGYRWIDGPATTVPFVSPGTTLVLNRGEPVEIAVVNRLDRATSVHWHGIELESYYDGVSGIGGSPGRVTPAVAPGQTFVVKFTPPRTGTFMYHTHLNDYQQLSTGLYGAIVVKEPGEPFDPDVDKVFVFSRGGPDDARDPVLINGSEWPDGIDLKKVTTYRLRFAGITPAPNVKVSIRSGATLQSWQPIAKDGMSFAHPAAFTAATESIQPGETFDFAFTPSAAGPLRLVAALSRVHTEMTFNVK
jgi:FtsP/CotA-like multicopper oxidase with cupredoxin domain